MTHIHHVTKKPRPSIHLNDVKSSQVKQIGYDPDTQTLAVTFTRGAGAVYHYPNVTEDDYKSFIKSDSIGSHFGKHIKSRPFDKFVQATSTA